MKNYSIFSELLQEKIKYNLAQKKQILLFLNRRGMATFVNCRDCGYVATCPNCETSLTFHYHSLNLICHHCDYKSPVPTCCPNCQSLAIKYFGSGTQKVEHELNKLFGTEIKVARMDKDTTAKRGSHEFLFNSFARNEVNILIGTQMITKGWDIPNVGLVGIITADTMLNFPDFSASEKTFDLLTQVAGRTGRGYSPGEVVLQTYSPEHPAIRSAAKHDFIAFYEEEIKNREELSYPPFARLIKLMYNNVIQHVAEQEMEKMSATIRNNYSDAQLLGPSPAFMPKLAGKYRYQLLLKFTGKNESEFIKIVKEIKEMTGEAWLIDVDPASLI